MIDNYAPFSAYNQVCGDELNALNTTKATSFMQAAQVTTDQSYWFTTSALIIVVMEWFVIIIIIMMNTCCRHLDCHCHCFHPNYYKSGEPAQVADDAVVSEAPKGAMLEEQLINQPQDGPI